GLLDKQGKIADSGKGNGYTAWRSITPEHNALVNAMLASPCHIIATMRSKQEYVLQVNDNGKQAPKKVGMAPIQRDGMEYEFTVMFDIDINHNATSTKDRTRLFDGKIFKITSETGEQLLAWLNNGVTKEQAEVNNFKEKTSNISSLDELQKLFAISFNNLRGCSEQEEVIEHYNQLKIKLSEGENNETV
ncbi:AAA family ATPase, partial [Gilliamella sp. Gris1-4]|uniref:AAA family ATPase n=2 Tax=Gilliamella TaxID=1193503 RepID=UPI000B2DE098